MAGFFDFLEDPQVLNTIGTGLQVAGQLQNASDQRAYGAESATASHYQAEQLREQAGSSVAAAQRQAWLEDRNAKIVMSNALAAAAASGGGASDPTVINIIAGIAQEGAYRRQVALYNGDDRARMLQMQAQAREMEGASRQDAADSAAGGSVLKAGTTFLSGMTKDASLFQRFGGGGPKVGGAAPAVDSWWANDGPDAY